MANHPANIHLILGQNTIVIYKRKKKKERKEKPEHEEKSARQLLSSKIFEEIENSAEVTVLKSNLWSRNLSNSTQRTSPKIKNLKNV